MYMLIAIEDIIDEPIDDRRLTYSLVAEEHDFVLQERWDSALSQVKVARICHFKYRILMPII